MRISQETFQVNVSDRLFSRTFHYIALCRRYEMRGDNVKLLIHAFVKEL